MVNPLITSSSMRKCMVFFLLISASANMKLVSKREFGGLENEKPNI